MAVKTKQILFKTSPTMAAKLAAVQKELGYDNRTEFFENLIDKIHSGYRLKAKQAKPLPMPEVSDYPSLD